MQRLLFLIAVLFTCGIQAQNGNVGIGTSSPAEKLHVAGNIKADTLKPNAFKLTADAATGKVLTSDAAGNASWQQAVNNGTSTPASAASIGYGTWGDCNTNAIIGGYQPVTDTDGVRQYSFGYKTFIAGNYAITGSHTATVGSNLRQGSATILQNIAGSWVPVQKITDAGGQTENYFGFSASISDSFAVVSAPFANTGANSGSGAVIIYKHVGNNWVQMQRLIDSSGNVYEAFGNSLYLSGNTLVVGAPGRTVSATSQGVVFIYQYNGSSWVYRQMLTDPAASANNGLGNSVSLSGNFVVAGSSGYNAQQGAACVFVNNGGNWSFVQRLTDPSGAAGDYFGTSVSISGNNLVAGASGTDLNGNVDQGAICIFHLTGTSWVFQQRLYDNIQGVTDDHFGSSICLSGNYIIVGAYKADMPAATNIGGAYLYVRIGSAWQKMIRFTDPAGVGGEYGGTDVFLDSSTRSFAIGVFQFQSSMGKVLFGKIQ